MKWFKIVVKDDAVADGALNRISNAFEAVLPPGDKAKGCVLFHRDEADASVVFISPQFAAVACQLLKSFSAVERDVPPTIPRKPDTEFGTLLLLASHSAAAWSILG